MQFNLIILIDENQGYFFTTSNKTIVEEIGMGRILLAMLQVWVFDDNSELASIVESLDDEQSEEMGVWTEMFHLAYEDTITYLRKFYGLEDKDGNAVPYPPDIKLISVSYDRHDQIIALRTLSEDPDLDGRADQSV